MCIRDSYPCVYHASRFVQGLALEHEVDARRAVLRAPRPTMRIDVGVSCIVHLTERVCGPQRRTRESPGPTPTSTFVRPDVVEDLAAAAGRRRARTSR